MTRYEQIVLSGINLNEETDDKINQKQSIPPEIIKNEESERTTNHKLPDISEKDINEAVESKTYYEQLDILESASKMEIKKAYFKLVKQYPPEKFPEKFKEYRKAYEVLIDENARAQYDKLCKVPKEYKDLYDLAQKAMKCGDYEYAIKLLKEVVSNNPSLQILNSLLGDIYLENGNTGNGVKIFEKLVKLEPVNSTYHGKLANAYSMRGYTKKAITQYEKSLALDKDNIDYIIGLSKAYSDIDNEEKSQKVLESGIAKARENGLENLDLHIYASFYYTVNNEQDKRKEHMECINKAIKNDPAIVEYVKDSLFHNISRIKEKENDFEIKYRILHLLIEIAPEQEDIKLLKEKYEIVYLYREFSNDEEITDELINLTGKLLDNCDCTICKIEKALLEGELLYTPEATKKALRYLKNKYPDYYKLNSEFYNKLLNAGKLQRLKEDSFRKIARYQKKYPEEFRKILNLQDGLQGFDDIDDTDDTVDINVYDNNEKYVKYNDYEEYDVNNSFFNPYEKNEPIVRTAPKIGRNDPCPCGSGKKYKRCCGVN